MTGTINDNVVNFLDKAIHDISLQLKIMDMNPDEIVSEAGKYGFDFTADELAFTVSRMASRGRESSSEIEIDELEGVAGGTNIIEDEATVMLRRIMENAIRFM